MPTSRNTLNRVLDEALEMTFPASDPVAVAAPGSTSHKGEAERDESAKQAEKPAPDEGAHRKR